MKKLLSVLALLLAFNVSANQEISVNVDELFVPLGFDTNDNAELVVSGILPNICYQKPRAEVEMLGRNIRIKVYADIDDQWNPHCEDFKNNKRMKIPFTEVIHLGVLDKGTYSVEVINTNKSNIFDSLAIAESSSSAVDEKVYAAVDYALRKQGDRKVKLVGYNPSDCYQLDKVESVSNKKNAYSVLPVMKKVSDFCPLKMVQFEYDFEVPRDLKSKNILLHIRRLEGKSVNVLLRNFN